MAEFKTARHQAIVPMDVAVVGTVAGGTKVTAANRKAAICRGDFVKYVPAASGVPAYIEKATAAEVAAKTATHIVALTDQTISDRHVPTDKFDYAPSELVGATANSASTTAPIKKVGLYCIFDWTDIIPDGDGNDAKANASS